jgi:hypothetical protein
MEMTPTNGTWRIKDGNLQLINLTTSLWHTVFVAGVAGAETPAIGDGES